MRPLVVSVGVLACLALACGPVRSQEAAGAEPAVEPAQLLQAPTLPPIAPLLPPSTGLATATPPGPAVEPGLLEPPTLVSDIEEFIGDQGPIGTLAGPTPGVPPTVPPGAVIAPVPPVPPGTPATVVTGPAGTPIVVPLSPSGEPVVPVRGVILVPSVRGFKVDENNSAVPRDRVFFSFNYYDNVNAAANRRLGAGVNNVQVYRETFGVEKLFLGGAASLSLLLPLNSLSAGGTVPGLGGTNTAAGDLSGIFKYAFVRDPAGTWVSAGLAVTAPTGPSSFAGSPNVVNLHSTLLQPFVAFYWTRGVYYAQGFTSVEVPTDFRDVTMFYKDVAAGYWLYRAAGPGAVLTGVAPTLEAHLNAPLDHRGVLRFTDPAGTPDVVNLTAGTNFILWGRARLAVGVVTPITGPKPFDVEAITQFRMLY